jgi:hypothetical protein
MSEKNSRQPAVTLTITERVIGVLAVAIIGCLLLTTYHLRALSEELNELRVVDNGDTFCDEEELLNAKVSDLTPCGRILDFLMQRHLNQFDANKPNVDSGRRIKS